MPVISSWILWRRSASWPQPSLQPPNLDWLFFITSWSTARLKGGCCVFYFPHRSSIDELQDRSIMASFKPATSSKWTPEGNAAGIQCEFGHCPWLLYQLAATVRGSSLLPHQWLLYFPTCQVNIWKHALALRADFCSHTAVIMDIKTPNCYWAMRLHLEDTTLRLRCNQGFSFCLMPEKKN